MKYSRIRRTPTFIADYSELRSYLKHASPLAFLALPGAMETILDVIDASPHGWPIRRKRMGEAEYIFHLAVINIAYRRLHLRYFIDGSGVSHLSTVWVDGHDEPGYTLP